MAITGSPIKLAEARASGEPFRGFSELDEIRLLPGVQAQTEERIVMIDDGGQITGAAVVKYGGCCHNAWSGVVRYCFVALREAWTGSVPTALGS